MVEEQAWEEREELAAELHAIGAVRFGDFLLKSGQRSSVYLDLRVLISHPRTLQAVARVLGTLVSDLSFDRIAGIPYAAIPIATALALEIDRPMIYLRREAKDYGTARTIEGEFNPGETALVLDDVITTGTSKIETVRPLEAAGLRITDVVVVVDREQGGVQELEREDLRVHSLFRLSELLAILRARRLIPADGKV